MAKIVGVTPACYTIPLPVAMSDSTHGTMTAFTLVTVRVRDADGAEGVGYTYTTGHNGRAIKASLDEIAEAAQGEDGDLIERMWQRMWWLLHYGGRGGAAVFALSAHSGEGCHSFRRKVATCSERWWPGWRDVRRHRRVSWCISAFVAWVKRDGAGPRSQREGPARDAERCDLARSGVRRAGSTPSA